MTRFVHKIIALFLLCPLLFGLGQGAHAHMLNMTRMEITVGEDQVARITLTIDLGQSLMTPQDYWAATQVSVSQQQAMLAGPMAQLEAQLVFLLDCYQIVHLINCAQDIRIHDHFIVMNGVGRGARDYGFPTYKPTQFSGRSLR